MDLLETGSEYRHPWELSRVDCLIKMILPYLSGFRKTVADIGCGDLFFTGKLAACFKGDIFAVDTGFTEDFIDDPSGDTAGDAENHSLSNQAKITILYDINQLEDNSIDIAVLMDVLEHIEDQNEFLTLLSKKLSDKALVFITVPAFMHLFSGHDVFLKHHRRYNKKSLSAVLTDNGFKIDRFFYFYSILYILRLLQFAATRRKKSDRMVNNISLWKKDEKSPVTRFLRRILNLDFRINKILGRFSLFGLSLCAIYKTST